MLLFLVIFVCCSPVENWNGYPMNVMAWSYGIGTICYGLSSLYYVYRGEMEVFRIPTEVCVCVCACVCVCVYVH